MPQYSIAVHQSNILVQKKECCKESRRVFENHKKYGLHRETNTLMFRTNQISEHQQKKL